MEDATANSGSAFEGGNGMTVEQCQKAIQKSFKRKFSYFFKSVTIKIVVLGLTI